jgi:plastocyanin
MTRREGGSAAGPPGGPERNQASMSTLSGMSRRWPAAVAAAAAAGVLGLSACGGPSGSAALAPASGTRLAGRPGATGAPLPPPTGNPSIGPMAGMSMPASAAPAGPAVATDAVKIMNFAFAPATITVKAGTTVHWTNMDTDAHTVTSDTGAFTSAALTTGASYAHTFTKPGTYAYHCSIHPFMVAVVVVTP